MPIERVTVSLFTRHSQAALLQQQVSEMMAQLAPQLSLLLERYIPAHAPVVEQLRVDVGSVPFSQFSRLFTPRLLAALEQALQQLAYSPEEQVSTALAEEQHAEYQRAISRNRSAQERLARSGRDVGPAGQRADAVSPDWSTLLSYLSHGYWPVFPAALPSASPVALKGPAAEPFGQPGISSPEENAVQRLPRQQVSGQQTSGQQTSGQQISDQPNGASGLSATSSSALTPEHWLRQRLAAKPAISASDIAALVTTLQLPDARQRLLRLVNASHWPRLCELLAPAARLHTASPLALLLLLWQQPDLTPVEVFSPAELAPPPPQALRELERLLTIGNVQVLTVLQPWLERFAAQAPLSTAVSEEKDQPFVVARAVQAGNSWPQRLSPAAQQQLARLLPAAQQQIVRLLPAAQQQIVRLLPKARQPSQSQNKPQALPESLALHHAGLVLLWPLLPGWLSSLGLLVQAEPQAPLRFRGPEAQQQAIALLDALIWQDEAGGEWRSLCSKLLCGWPLTWPLEDEWHSELAQQQAQQLEPALQALLFQLPGLKNLSLADLRQLFLQRPGTLEQQRYGWQLSVAPHPADILLRHIPWPLEQIHYGWLTEPITLHWPRPDYGISL